MALVADLAKAQAIILKINELVRSTGNIDGESNVWANKALGSTRGCRCGHRSLEVHKGLIESFPEQSE